MCGLTGVMTSHGNPEHYIPRMMSALRHRGPDDEGSWCDGDAGIGLGHTRLAIIDTSAAGHQPMISHCGRFVLAFNGEIYNHPALRAELAAEAAGPPWRGDSDTETLLAAISHWGVVETLRRAAGMFAIALWDRQQRLLHLARDRMGEKPLYYGWAGGSLVFGSELKAIKAHPDFVSKASLPAVHQYLRFGYVPSPLSIWERVFKLEAGCILTVWSCQPPGASPAPLRPGEAGTGMSMARYWSLAEVVEQGRGMVVRDEAEAIAGLEEALELAVRRQMMSDVPLGAFLSGGIDSSLVVALMQRNSAKPVRSFTVGFDEQDFDESPHAARVARHIGTEHTEIRVSSADARAAIPLMPGIFDEPFADASQIPTFLISRAARTAVKVALTGDAGDELFGGYERYRRVPELWGLFGNIPVPLRRGLAAALSSVPEQGWGFMQKQWGRYAKHPRPLGDRVSRLCRRLSTLESVDDLYLDLVAAWPNPQLIEAFRTERAADAFPLPSHPLPSGLGEDVVARLMYYDSLTYLPDDILCKVDRTSMSVSLETRAPLLDPAVVTYAARLPASLKIRNGQGKWALKQVLHKLVPAALVERPKLGFFLPIGQWLRGPLRDWAEALVEPANLSKHGFLSPGPIRHMWSEHLSGRRDATLQMWTILMFQAWAEANL